MARVQKINSRRLILVAGAIALTGCLAAAGFTYRRQQIARHFQQLRADGMTADARHDPATAILLLGKYLARYPDDVPALTRFADDRLLVPMPDDQQVALAIPALRYAVHMNPSLQAQQRTLMGLYLQNGYWTEALQTADALLAAQPSAASRIDRQSLQARATALSRLRRINEATAAADAWCTADPGSVDARLLRLDLAHVVDLQPLQLQVMFRSWTATGALSTMSVDLLKGHARLFDLDPAEARTALTAAASDVPFDAQAAGPLARDLEFVGLPALALEVTRKRHLADPTNLAIIIELVRREWIAQQFQAVVDLVLPVGDRSLLPTETIGLDAVARSELGHPEQIAPIARELLSRADAVSRAWAEVVGQLSTGKFEPEKLLAACAPALRDTDGPILRYYVGESYLTLGDRQRAALEWQRVLATDPAWALPAIHLCQLLTEDRRPRSAMAAGFEAVRRANHAAQAAKALACAWALAVDAGQDSDIEGCLALIDQLIKQLPDDFALRAIEASVLARGGRAGDSASVIRRALADTRVLPEQVWFDFAATSAIAQLGLEKQCLERDRLEYGVTPRSAYARAIFLHFSIDTTTQPASTDPGLAAFDNDRAVAGDSPPTLLAWMLARAKYLDAVASPAATQAWGKLSDDYPGDARIQQFVIASAAIQTDATVMHQAVQRLKAVSGADSITSQLAQARFDVNFGKTSADANEARQLIDEILRQSPDSLEARILSARAYEKAGHAIGAITDLRAALNIDPESVPVRLGLARLLQSQGDFAAAMDQFDHLDLARLTTDDQRQQAAALLSQHGESDRAVGLLRGPVQSQSPAGRLMLARLYQKTGQTSQALDVIHALLKSSPSPAAIAFGADLLGSVGRIDEGRHLLDRLSELPPGAVSPAIADLIRAAFALRYLSSRSADAALALFASATLADPYNSTAWHARISAELAVNRPDDAISAAAEGLKLLPSDTILRFFGGSPEAIQSAATDKLRQPLLAAALRDASVVPAVSEILSIIDAAANGDERIDSLANRLSEIARQYPAFPEVELYLVGVFEMLHRIDDAVTIATRAGHSFPDNPAVLKAETNALFQARRWSEVIQIAGKWKKESPGESLDADLLTADAMINAGRGIEVESLLRPYTDHPGLAGYLQAMARQGKAQFAGGQPNPEAGLEPLLQQGADGRAAWMKFAVDVLPPAQAADDIRRAVALMPAGSLPEQVTASEMWMRLYDRAGNLAYGKAAVDLLQPYLSDTNAPIQLLLAEASWQEKLGDTDNAQKLYRRILTAFPNLPEADNNLAMILARSGRPKQAVPLLDNAIKATPLLADLYDTRAYALWKSDQVQPAIADIQHALQLDPWRMSFRVRRIQLLAAAGRAGEAQSALRCLEWNYADPDLITPEFQRELADARASLKQ